MIRIGLSRWFIEIGKAPMNFGRVKHFLALRPQARIFKIFASEWKGIHHSMVEKEVCAEPVMIESIDDVYGMTPLKEMLLVRKLATEAASDAVYKCYASGILAHRLPDPDVLRYHIEEVDNDTSRALLVYIVEQAVMRAVSSGISDEDETVALVNLAPHMRELYDQQEAERVERARLRREEAERMYAERTRDLEIHRKASVAATETSFELLSSVLSNAEKEEWKTKGYITVKNLLGEFRVPVTKHGFVEQYVDGKHTQNHCIVFSDWTIPPGDETLMKVVLLKTDPRRFMKVSNKQPIRRR